MDISPALSADVRDMLRVLDLPDLDVERTLATLLVNIRVAVPSFVGLSMTLRIGGQPVTLTSLKNGTAPAQISSSLQFPLTLTVGVEHGSRLTLYATTPGAFVDLAADLGYVTAAPQGTVRVDVDLAPSGTRSGLTGVAELSIVNRAVGLLIGRGLTPVAARDYLQQKADQSHVAAFQLAAFMVSMTE